MRCDSLILGKIITMEGNSPCAQAMACKDGRIIYIGSKEIAEQLCNENTKVFDYSDNIVYPGFWDSHTHGELAGQRIGYQADMQFAKSLPECVSIMKKYIENNPGRPYYLGAGWDKYGEPTAAMLDAICPDVPMVLRSLCGHMVWVNTVAMKKLGFGAEQAKELGPELAHMDANGNPTGWMSDNAALPFIDGFPPSKEDLKKGILLWQDFAFQKGMTAVVEAYADMYDGAMDAYKELADEGKLKLRTYGFSVNVKNLANGPEAFADDFVQLTGKYNSEYFKMMGFKMFMDGTVDAHTADLLEEYDDMPGYTGFSQLEGREDYIKACVKAINGKGIPCHVHAIGDAAVRKAVNIFAESEVECGNFNLRNMIAHLEMVNPEEIRRIAEYHLIPVVAPLWVHKDPVVFPRELVEIGADRAYSRCPVKSFEDAGATVCFHTDYPISPVVDKPIEIYQAVRRGAPEQGPKSVRNADEGISPLQCLQALTINAAYAVGQEHNLGTLAVGKIANAVVYDKNFLACDVEDIPNAKLLATIIDGEPVYTL